MIWPASFSFSSPAFHNKTRKQRRSPVGYHRGVGAGVNMSWQVAKYRHPAICVQDVAGNTYQFTVRDDRTIEQPASDDDARDTAHRVAITYLRSYRRWFGHWIPLGHRPTAGENAIQAANPPHDRAGRFELA